VIELGERALSAAEIVTFAQKWDPQFFHTDPVAAVDGPFGGLVASGWHTASLWVRMFVDEVLSRSAALGGPGVEELRFHQPTRPGQLLRCRLVVHDLLPSTKRADRGTMLAEARIVDQAEELVMTFRFRTYLSRRTPATVEP
jgi:acyl dehydratase